jgi:deazaflavin-dependent oxidoreductase (nitroreductase family)
MQIRLATTGRRSGKPHEVPLYGFEDGDRLVIVGSYGGRAHNPAWVHNLHANQRAVVKRGRQRFNVRAREVDGPERDRLWQLVTKAFPLYETYQRKTKRRIPLFVLETIDR